MAVCWWMDDAFLCVYTLELFLRIAHFKCLFFRGALPFAAAVVIIVTVMATVARVWAQQGL